jgi:hypothetical protein
VFNAVEDLQRGIKNILNLKFPWFFVPGTPGRQWLRLSRSACYTLNLRQQLFYPLILTLPNQAVHKKYQCNSKKATAQKYNDASIRKHARHGPQEVCNARLARSWHCPWVTAPGQDAAGQPSRCAAEEQLAQSTASLPKPALALMKHLYVIVLQ